MIYKLGTSFHDKSKRVIHYKYSCKLTHKHYDRGMAFLWFQKKGVKYELKIKERVSFPKSPMRVLSLDLPGLISEKFVGGK